ncbi:hypothetical protein [Teichococcus aestuarii]|uniref:hypothetical protein n=1 Tax=Teichococcus aestuarii TaxID=568898 RepID=UPI00361678C3
MALAPEAAETKLALAHACREAGALPEAIRMAEAALAHHDPDVAGQARFLLAALGRAPAPERAPAAYVRDLFDQYAPRFAADLTGRLGYRTPAALAALLRDSGLAPEPVADALDLGCGTGLSGRRSRPSRGGWRGWTSRRACWPRRRARAATPPCTRRTCWTSCPATPPPGT